MKISTAPTGSDSRFIWLRRGSQSNSSAVSNPCSLKLSAIGNAAARETLVTATPHMAAIWTDLFHSLIVPNSHYLCWRDNGPGIGRDARIAYSSLLGRYMARAYLTERESVHVLVPLDVAKHRLRGTPYVIKKHPAGRGLEADWIGLDDSGLVIVEAKGTYNTGIQTWQGPHSVPQVLQTAIEQSKRTAVFSHSSGKLPAKRWAIASRWGTEDNLRDTTLLAWDPEEERLNEDDYWALAHVLYSADVDGVVKGMGHAHYSNGAELSSKSAAIIRLRIGDQLLERGIAAMVGPFGVYPFRALDDHRQLQQVREMNLDYSIVLLSQRYALGTRGFFREFKELGTTDERSASRRGLTVVWPRAEDEVTFEEE